MEAILKHLEDGLQACSTKITELANSKKEYETKFNNLNDLEAKLKHQGVKLDEREKKIKHIEDVEEYSKSLDEKAEKIRKDRLELSPKIKEHETTVNNFKIYREKELKRIEDDDFANKKQGDALIKERNAFNAEVKAYKGMKGAFE